MSYKVIRITNRRLERAHALLVGTRRGLRFRRAELDGSGEYARYCADAVWQKGRVTEYQLSTLGELVGCDGDCMLCRALCPAGIELRSAYDRRERWHEGRRFLLSVDDVARHFLEVIDAYVAMPDKRTRRQAVQTRDGVHGALRWCGEALTWF